MTTRTIDVAGVRTVFREAGDGPAVLLVPGLGLSGRFYENSFAAFAGAGLRLVVPDLPGFGDSEPDPAARGVAELAAFALRFADALGLDQPAWIGHSVGAQICLAAAASQPERVRAAVLVGPTGLADRRRRLSEAVGLVREAVRAPWPVVRTVARDYIHTSPRRYIRLWLRATAYPALEAASIIPCPALVVVGDSDPVVPLPAARLLGRALLRGRVAVVRGAGHALPREDFRGFHSVVLPFLVGKDGCRE